MKVIDAYVEFIDNPDWDRIIKKIELCGRVCYKSEDKITIDSDKRFIKNIIKRGHEAVLEHASFSVKFTCDRGISHQIVRHRIASYCQESTRYCNYMNDKFSNEICVIKPCFFDECSENYKTWFKSCLQCEKNYFELIKNGAKPEEARNVLPNSLKTELVMTANIREWRHFLKLRTSKAAHPQIRELANMTLNLFNAGGNILFEDINQKWRDLI